MGRTGMRHPPVRLLTSASWSNTAEEQGCRPRQAEPSSVWLSTHRTLGPAFLLGRMVSCPLGHVRGSLWDQAIQAKINWDGEGDSGSPHLSDAGLGGCSL